MKHFARHAHKFALVIVCLLLVTISLQTTPAAAQSTTITLNFNSLPSSQGWTYVTSGSASENSIYSVSNGVLHQNAIGIGGTYASYKMENVIDPSKNFSVSVRARLINAEGPFFFPTDSCGFGFALQAGSVASYYGMCMDLQTIRDISGNVLSQTVDTTQFHDYRMDATPGQSYRFYVDNTFISSGAPRTLNEGNMNWLVFGDISSALNGQVDIASYTFTQTQPFNFNGFFPPVDNQPTVNVAKAGSAVPVKFSLGGDKGLNIFAAGYPVSSAVACAGGTESAVEETVTANSSGLQYDSSADQYIYVWKTDKAWENTCRTLTVKLSDGSVHSANFQFK